MYAVEAMRLVFVLLLAACYVKFNSVHASASAPPNGPPRITSGWTPRELLDWKVQMGENFTHFESGDLCACLLNEEAHRFSIKCDAEDMSHVHEAWSILANEPACASELGCLAESNNSTCRKNFFIVQAHHDHCIHDAIPTEIEKGYHSFDQNCWHCNIERGYQDGFPTCPEVDCTNEMLANFAARVLGSACGVPEEEGEEIEDCCNTAQEISAFRLILSLHDYCGPTAPKIVDELLHDYEEACEEHFCNTSTESYRGDLCPFNDFVTELGEEINSNGDVISGGSNDKPCPSEDLQQCLMAGATSCYVASSNTKTNTASQFTSDVSICWFSIYDEYDCDFRSNGAWLLESDAFGGFLPPAEGFPQCLMPCPLLDGSQCTLCGGPLPC